LKIIEHRKWLNVAYDSIQDGLLILNTKYEVKDYNTRLCKILGISKENFATINIQELLKDVLKDQNIFDSKAVIAYRETSLYLNQQRIECGITVSPVLENELCLGTVIAVKELELVRSVVNKVAGNSACYTFNHILTKSANMENLIQLAKKTAKNDCPVLIQGESGTGKELFAHAIHSSSARSQAPFVAVNCAALPKDLVESELFGYAKGAFTGALKEGKPGKFELANGGTIFLDEIGELPLEVQAKLLRVLDNYTVTRIGGNFERTLDIRVIAATNRDLADEITKHNFRSDLFYRLNVLRLFLHPLRERPGDITYCAECFLERLNKKSKEADKYYDASFLDAIESYEWKGNLRELQNIVQRAFYISEDQQISVDMLPDSIVGKESPSLPTIAPVQTIVTRIKTLEEMESELLSSALTQCSGNVVAASKMINIGKSTFYRKLKEYHIDYSQIGKN
jgi:transcriptional regulator with PAS, ATPase and Fis domain